MQTSEWLDHVVGLERWPNEPSHNASALIGFSANGSPIYAVDPADHPNDFPPQGQVITEGIVRGAFPLSNHSPGLSLDMSFDFDLSLESDRQRMRLMYGALPTLSPNNYSFKITGS